MNKQTAISPATGPHVYAAIAAVQGELATVGIAKTRKNSQGSGYMFRGIDDVYGALSPLLAKHSLVVIPRITTRELVERSSKNGGALFYVTVHAEFDFVSAIDGSIHVAATFGEAMDSGDKATNKAMSAAYKYAAFMTFAIPTEGDNDADSATHEVAPRADPAPPAMIDDDQRDQIMALSKASGVAILSILDTVNAKLPANAKVKDLNGLTHATADSIVKKLNATIAAKAKAQPLQAAPVEDILEDSIPY
jgi:hypothetical protein